MGEEKRNLIIPDSVDNALKNLTDMPTKSMGDTISDIWYLVFGGIQQAAEKRKMKYAYDLQCFEKELSDKLSLILKENKLEPNMQIVAPALESAKYCIQHKILRDMFSSLITASLDSTRCEYVHPSFVDIVRQMTPLDANNLLVFKKKSFHPICSYRILFKDSSFDDYYKIVFLSNINEQDVEKQELSISTLLHLGLVNISFDIKLKQYEYEPFLLTKEYNKLAEEVEKNIIPKAKGLELHKGMIEITALGQCLIKACTY